MNKFTKWLLAVLGVIALLAVVAAVVLPLTFDPNNYKDEIQKAVKDETGRDLNIGGDIGWTVFPWLGFEVNDITLGNRQGFGAEPMLKAGQAAASVKIMPLLSKRVEIGKVTLKDMEVRLTRKANGENNWTDLTAGSASDHPSNNSRNSQNTGIKSVQISGIEISNANVHWDDAGQITELSNANLSASGIADHQPFDLKGGFSLALSELSLNGAVKFAGHVTPAEGDSDLQIENLTLNFEGRQGIAPDQLALDIGMNANAVMDEKDDSMSLNNFKFRLHNMHVTGDLKVSSLSNKPGFKGALVIAEFSPAVLMENMGMDVPLTSNPEALTKLGVKMNITGSANEAIIQNLNMQLDTSSIAGRFKVHDFSRPTLDFDLSIDSLNLDDYLPPAVDSVSPSSATVSNSSSAGNKTSSESDLDAAVFRGYSGGGSFKIGKLIIAGLTATNVSTTMSGNGNGLRFYPTLADFYNGRNQSDIRIDASGDRPMLTISEDLSGVQAKGLLQDLTGKASRLLGTASMKMNLHTDLSNSSSVRKTLSGDLSLTVLDGAFVGIDVADTISQARSLLGKQDKNTEPLNDSAKTEFAKLALSGLINNGILSSDDLDLSSTLLRATGKGRINLIDETIDYLVKPVLSDNIRGQDKSTNSTSTQSTSTQKTSTLTQLSGVAVPIRISGSLYDPHISVDIVGAITDSQKAKIDAKKTELTNKLFDKLLGDDDKNKADKQPDESSSATEKEVNSSHADSATEVKQTDPAEDLLNSLFGSKKDKKKKKNAEDQPENGQAETGT